MKNIFYLLIFFSIAIQFVSCSKTVDYNFPEIENKLVINSFFTSDSTFKILVSHTLPILQSGTPIVDNAEVKLYENGVFKENLSYSNYFYHSVSKPVIGKNYKIKVTAPNYQEVSANDTMPDNPQLLQTEFIKDFDVVTENDGQTNNISRLKCLINDNLQIKRYYEIVVYIRYWDDYSQQYYIDNVGYKKNNDEIINNENLIDYYPDSIIFSNELFTSNQQNINVDFFSGIISEVGIQNFQVIVVFRQVSKNYYEYRKSLTLHEYFQNNDDEIWGSPAPVDLFTNIQNGEGVFAAYNEVRDTINYQN